MQWCKSAPCIHLFCGITRHVCIVPGVWRRILSTRHSSRTSTQEEPTARQESRQHFAPRSLAADCASTEPHKYTVAPLFSGRSPKVCLIIKMHDHNCGLQPLDIANGVRFLCSSEAKFITVRPHTAFHAHVLTFLHGSSRHFHASTFLCLTCRPCLRQGHVMNIDGGLTIQLQEDMGMRQAEFREEQLKAKL
jgi:hypothetical protein